MTTPGEAITTPAKLDPQSAALSMVIAWMGNRFYRTFRPSDEGASSFDAILTQRDRRIGVTIGLLAGSDPTASAGAAPEHETNNAAFAELLTSDLDQPGGYALWLPPGAVIPTEEPARSDLRILLSNGLSGLNPGDHREVRIPIILKLAKIETGGAYVSVTGGLSSQWTTISEGIDGAFHLDSRPLHRLPAETAELDIIISRVRDRAALLNAEEVTDVKVHDYWLVTRLPDSASQGVVVIGGPPELDPLDGIPVRRSFRRHVSRAVEQRQSGDSELSVLILVGALAHMEDELVTSALRGMNPAAYGALDLIVLVADGSVRQVLQPRSLPWEQERAPS
jgi:hypothetical protein